MDCLDRIS